MSKVPEPETPLTPIEPAAIRIQGSQPVVRVFHHDPRGFLVETLRSDDLRIDGARFQLAYSSLTRPGHFRDADRWHVHKVQTDRFMVALGEMILALYDDREKSTTKGILEVIRMQGEAYDAPAPSRGETESYLVPIPPGVLHCIGNLSDHPFLLQNFPTELYNPSDEGRVPFADLPLPALGGRSFSWSTVRPPYESEAIPRPTS